MSLLQCILFCAMAACVLGHSVLNSPSPLNANPTKTAPCGVTTYPAKPVASASYKVGSAQSLTWQLVATDGGTSLSANIDLTGGTAFTTPVFAGLAFGAKGNAKYPLSFTAPAAKCTSPTGLCIMRMVSNTGWNSCIYVNVTDAAVTAAAAPAASCVTAKNLAFCTNRNGAQVTIPPNADIDSLDNQTAAAFTAAINNPDVFTAGTSAECKTLFAPYLCSLNMPPCTTGAAGGACKSNCVAAMAACQLTTAEALLYDCSTLPACPAEGADSASTTAKAASAVLAASAVASLLF